MHLNTSGGQFDPTVITHLPAAVRGAVFFTISHAVHYVFLWAVPFSAIVFVIGWFIKEVPLRGRAPEVPAEQERAPELTA